MNQRVKGILFDLGETLLEFGKVDAVEFFRLGCMRACERLRQFGAADVPFKRYHRRQYLSVRWHVVMSHLTRRDFNIMEMVDRVGRSMGHRLSREQLIELAWLWYEPLSERARIEPGLPEMLAELAGHGLTLGIVSNTFLPGEVIDRQLAMLGLLEHLPVRVYSSRTRHRKPGRRIFHEALRLAKLEPHETIFVGDSVRNDVRGANRMGMISVLKDPARQARLWLARPRFRIRALARLPRVVKHLQGGGWTPS